LSLVDTDVFVWYLRGNTRAAAFLVKCQPICFSAVTYMELVQGMRDRRELQILRKAVRAQEWRLLPVDAAVSNRAVIYVEKHFLSGALRLADALIAATAVEHGLALATANTKHYRAIDELTLERFRPT
jgi:predicted nucleic acid-binding protein